MALENESTAYNRRQRFMELMTEKKRSEVCTMSWTHHSLTQQHFVQKIWSIRQPQIRQNIMHINSIPHNEQSVASKQLTASPKYPTCFICTQPPCCPWRVNGFLKHRPGITVEHLLVSHDFSSICMRLLIPSAPCGYSFLLRMASSAGRWSQGVSERLVHLRIHYQR